MVVRKASAHHDHRYFLSNLFGDFSTFSPYAYINQFFYKKFFKLELTDTFISLRSGHTPKKSIHLNIVQKSLLGLSTSFYRLQFVDSFHFT